MPFSGIFEKLILVSSSRNTNSKMPIDMVTMSVTTLDENTTTMLSLLNMTSLNNTTTSVIGDESNSFLTFDTYERFAFICNTIVTPILCIFGIVFNGLGLGVIWPDIKEQKMSIYIYLCALTLSDMIYLALGLIREIPAVMKYLKAENSDLFEETMKRVVIYIDIVFSHTSTGMILVMSLERTIALVRPLHVKTTWFAKYPIRIVIICFVFNIIFLLPFAIYLEVTSYTTGNSTEYYLRFNPNVETQMKYYMIAQTIVDYFIPTACLLITTTIIPIKYYTFSKERRINLSISSGNIANRQMKITTTVFAITFMYFLLSVPNISVKILGLVDEEYSFDGKHKLVFWFAIDLSNLFFIINAANDCVIYILVSEYYRNIFRMKYCKCCRHNTRYRDDSQVASRAANAISACSSMVLY